MNGLRNLRLSLSFCETLNRICVGACVLVYLFIYLFVQIKRFLLLFSACILSVFQALSIFGVLFLYSNTRVLMFSFLYIYASKSILFANGGWRKSSENHWAQNISRFFFFHFFCAIVILFNNKFGYDQHVLCLWVSSEKMRPCVHFSQDNLELFQLNIIFAYTSFDRKRYFALHSSNNSFSGGRTSTDDDFLSHLNGIEYFSGYFCVVLYKIMAVHL